MDENATENFFGLIVSVYSLGQIISSPLVGWWSNKSRQTKSCLYYGIITMLTGNIIYFFTGIIPFEKKYVILISRFITGFGSCKYKDLEDKQASYKISANVSLLKAYATSASTGSDRSKAIAYVTGGLALGMTTGPALQLIFTPLGPKGFRLLCNLYLNIYTAPAVMACAINITGGLLIYFFFVERTIGVADKATIVSTSLYF